MMQNAQDPPTRIFGSTQSHQASALLLRCSYLWGRHLMITCCLQTPAVLLCEVCFTQQRVFPSHPVPSSPCPFPWLSGILWYEHVIFFLCSPMAECLRCFQVVSLRTRAAHNIPSLLLKRFILAFSYVQYVCLCVCTCECSTHRDQKGASGALELASQAVLSSMWMLGTEPRPSERASSDLNISAVSPQP